MKSKDVQGMVVTNTGVSFTNVTIRAEKTGNFTTISFSDDKKGIMIQVDYNDIKKLMRGL